MSEGIAAPGTTVLLIRHGETQWNLDQRIQGHLDVALTERGEEQARRLAAWLAEDAVDAVYSSDLARARRTAEILAGDRLEVQVDPRYREAHFGEWEGKTTPEIQARFPVEYEAWRTDSLRHRAPGGETLAELLARSMAALREHLPQHPGRTVAVVAHGGPVRAMVCGLVGLPLDFYPRLRVENTSVARVLFTSRGPVLAGLNDISHLRAGAALPQHAGWEEK